MLRSKGRWIVVSAVTVLVVLLIECFSFLYSIALAFRRVGLGSVVVCGSEMYTF
jgi:hypothetical protein